VPRLMIMSRLERIVSNPAVCHGQPAVQGLRYPVEMILELGNLTLIEGATPRSPSSGSSSASTRGRLSLPGSARRPVG